MFIEEIVQALRKARVRFGLAGGYAVALHGAVRGTVDINIVIPLEKKQFRAAQKALSQLGLVSRLPVDADQVFDFREEYIANRNLLAWDFCHPQDPSKRVDILITHDIREQEVTRIRAGELVIPILGIHSLIAMKKAAGRPQDLEDIRALGSLQ